MNMRTVVSLCVGMVGCVKYFVSHMNSSEVLKDLGQYEEDEYKQDLDIILRDMFEYLISSGADPNIKNEAGETPFMLFCKENSYL